jgi:hypothetical protein
MSYRRRSQLFACVGVLIGVRLVSSLLVPQRTQLKLYVCLEFAKNKSRRADSYQDEGDISIDLEPNARVVVPLDPQRSEIVSTMGRPHPPLMSGRGQGSEGASKPEPGSHTLPRTEPAETGTVSEIWSSGESSAWRILLVTSSLTTSRTSSSFSCGKRSTSWSRAWRAVVTTSGLGSRLRSISVTINKSQHRGQDRRHYVPSVTQRVTTRCYTALDWRIERYVR